jgi:hypothetical protein
LIGGSIASGTLGGLGSVAGGGKFANGAITAAFGYLFNESGGYCERGYAYCTRDAAAFAAISEAMPASVTMEWGGLIYEKEDGTYGYTTPLPGAERQIQTFSRAAIDMLPNNVTVDGDYHTHPQYQLGVRVEPQSGDAWNNFSIDDRDSANWIVQNRNEFQQFCIRISPDFGIYVGTPSGEYRLYQPNDPNTWRGLRVR